MLASAWLLLAAAQADEIVLTSGERFISDKVWEEKGKIRFNMQGLVVSVDEADVATIVRDNGPATPSPDHPTSSSTRSRQDAPSDHSSTRRPRMAPASAQEPGSRPVQLSAKKSGNHQKIKGIGFDGITWHMRPTDLPGLSKIKTEEIYGGIDQYWLPDGPLTLDDALLDGQVFGFWRNRLYTITMWIDGKHGYEQLKRVLFERYGPGKKSKKNQDRYVWLDDKTTDRLLEFDANRNIGLFWMRSRDLDAHIKSQYPESVPG